MKLIRSTIFNWKTLHFSNFGKVILNVNEISVKIEGITLHPSTQPFILESEFVIIWLPSPTHPELLRKYVKVPGEVFEEEKLGGLINN